MILTPLSPDALPAVLDTFDAGLADYPFARAVFQRIAATARLCPGLKADLHAGRDKAIALAKGIGIGICDEDPAAAYSWDGHVIRTRSEASVVFHEIAHWQIAAPERRGLYDFGLGAGPETGHVDQANRAVCVDFATKEKEENLASLLGILWEAEFNEPAILAFAEQNWLELAERPYTRTHFAVHLDELKARGLIDADGRPVR
jgi:hypothetical protein